MATVNKDWFEEAMARGGADWLVDDIGGGVLEGAEQNVPVENGDLLRSLGKEEAFEKGEFSVRVGSGCGEGRSPVPYAARIELGFHGYDSLGRYYDQDGQPYLTPSLYRRSIA